MNAPAAARSDEPARSSPANDAEHWVELRVHGVSGTPPESIMLTGFVRQVAGDARGRFFRPADSLGNEQQQVDGRILEAYHWGRFTSGTWTQALWLLIIPFGVVNAAAFTLPRAFSPVGRFCRAAATACLRLIGLCLTCLLIFSSVVVALDLFAWQWKGAGAGGAARLWLPAAAALPLGALLLFFLFGRSQQAGQDPGQDRHNEKREPERSGRARRPTDPLASELAQPDFFGGDPDAPALRRLHAAAPLHMIAALLLWPAAERADGAATTGRLIAFILLAVAVVTVVFLGDPERAGGNSGWHTYAALASRIQLWVALRLTVFALGAVAADHSERAAGYGGVDGAMPGMSVAAFVLLFTLTAGVLVLLIATLCLALAGPKLADTAEQRAFAPFAGGMTAFLLGSVGAFLGVGFAAAFAFAAQLSINRSADISVTVPQILQRVAYAWGLTVLEIAVLAVIGGFSWLIRRRSFESAAAAAFELDGRPPLGLPPAWRAKVGTAMFLARLKNAVPAVFWVLVATGVVLSVSAVAEQLALERNASPSEANMLGVLSQLNDGGAGWVVWLGTTTLSALSVALIVLGRGAVRAEKSRRGVNVVWDVVAFWPRAVHPFVPPPYSQHVVAGLRRRISWHLGTLDDPQAAPPAVPATRVVVAAHSQGSLITAAALLWLTPAERQRVGVVTFGSQLQQQFARAFPAAVDTTLLHWVWNNYEHRWRNLYRDTDPIAGPVLSWAHKSVTEPGRPISDNIANPDNRAGPAPVLDLIVGDWGRRECGPDWRLLDPTRADVALMGGPMAVIRGHGDYPADPDWAAAVAAVLPPLPTIPG